MSRPHLTLYGQILFWFFLNLALVAAILFFVLKLQFRVDPRELLGGRTREQFRAASSVMSGELRNAPRAEWEEILKRFRFIELCGGVERTYSSFVKGYTRMSVKVHDW